MQVVKAALGEETCDHARLPRKTQKKQNAMGRRRRSATINSASKDATINSASKDAPIGRGETREEAKSVYKHDGFLGRFGPN